MPAIFVYCIKRMKNTNKNNNKTRGSSTINREKHGEWINKQKIMKISRKCIDKLKANDYN